jgi:hypothetical protein
MYLRLEQKLVVINEDIKCRVRLFDSNLNSCKIAFLVGLVCNILYLGFPRPNVSRGG